jgi:hypothetical protein
MYLTPDRTEVLLKSLVLPRIGTKQGQSKLENDRLNKKISNTHTLISKKNLA